MKMRNAAHAASVKKQRYRVGFSAQTLFNQTRIRGGRFNPEMKLSSGSELMLLKAVL